MSQERLRAQLARLVISRSRLKLERVGDDDTLDFQLGYDSHALLNLLLDIEDAFGLEVPPERVPELVGLRFGDLLELVAKFQSAREPAS